MIFLPTLHVLNYVYPNDDNSLLITVIYLVLSETFLDEARPFFSRRIGLALDANDNLIQNDIIAGA